MAIQSTGVLQAAGVGSGIDIASLVSQLVAAERKPDDDRLSAAQSKASTQLSAVGQLKSALANFQSTLSALSRLSGFQQRKTTVADNNKIFSATAAATAQLGTYEIEVDTLASAQKLTSGAFGAADATIANGQLTITVGEVATTIQITDSNNTVAGIAGAINSAADNPGVRATVITSSDGAHLVLTATRTGADSAFTIDGTDTTPGGTQSLESLDFGAGTTNSLTQATAAADASLLIDGLPVTSADNVVRNAIPGITINLLDADPETTNTLTVENDQSAVAGNVNQFAQAYNALIKVIGGLTSYDATTKSSGPLFGNPLPRDLKNQIRRELGAITTDPAAAFRSVSDIGVQFQADGTLQVNANKLSAALQNNFDAVGNLFARAGTGLAVRLKTLTDNALDASTGAISAQTTGLQNQLKSIAAQQDRLNARMDALQATYQAQFNAMDTLVARLKSTSSFLASQLTGSNTSSG